MRRYTALPVRTSDALDGVTSPEDIGTTSRGRSCCRSFSLSISVNCPSAVSPTAVQCSTQSPDEFGLMKPGSILVCPMTNPAWTALFAHASGLVTDIGGILGHGSIVAREYGIPAVVGTGIGMQRIQHAQQITVDVDEGTVDLTDTTPGV